MNSSASPPLRTGREVWELLAGRGGLQPDGWDAPLVEQLRVELKLGGGDLASELDVHAVTPEQLIPELFRTFAPFASSFA